MLTILIALIIAVLLIYLSIRINDSDSVIFFVFGMFIAVLGILFGIIGSPISATKYDDWETKTTYELVSLSESTNPTSSTGLIFVSISSDNVYTYRIEIDSEFGSQESHSYISKTVKGSNVVVVEDPGITSPYMEICSRHAKPNAWSFNVLNSEEKVVFYVPDGTVSRDVNI